LITDVVISELMYDRFALVLGALMRSMTSWSTTMFALSKGVKGGAVGR
jgi:hypothetical protein